MPHHIIIGEDYSPLLFQAGRKVRNYIVDGNSQLCKSAALTQAKNSMTTVSYAGSVLQVAGESRRLTNSRKCCKKGSEVVVKCQRRVLKIFSEIWGLIMPVKLCLSLMSRDMSASLKSL